MKCSLFVAYLVIFTFIACAPLASREPALKGADSTPQLSVVTKHTAEAGETVVSKTITGRTTTQIIAILANDEGLVSMVSGKKLDVLRAVTLKMARAISQGETILSLGEGRSPLIREILQARQTRSNGYLEKLVMENPGRSREELLKSARIPGGSNIDNAHGVDVAYPAHDESGHITDKRMSTTEEEADLDHFDQTMIPIIQAYPKNYHSQLFQGLDLKDEAGRRKQFSMIISVMALNYIMKMVSDSDAERLGGHAGSKGLEELTPDKELRKMMERVLDHLQPGGMLLVTSYQRLAMQAAYFGYLKKLREGGKISDYNKPAVNALHIIIK